MELHFTWKPNKGQYSNGENLYLNRIRVAGYGWNSTRNRDAEPRKPDWVGRIDLPSLKQASKFGDTTDEVKGKIEQSVTNWLNEATK